MPSDKIQIELLAPARDKECAFAAIDHGADAVYIGAARFGARAAAGNSDEDIARVVQYARPFGVKVYVTLNTLLEGEEELREARDLAWRMYRIGVDALIVQDERIRLLPDMPPIPLHASTQMDNRTAEKVQRLHGEGYEQVVLARELTIEEIADIHHQVPDMPLEVFIHGAICVSYNGRCYASEVCYGRSANRGECAQFCRMPYDLETADGEKLLQGRYLLSMRDMNRTAHLEALLDAGARSLKIEGRLKDAAYVKNVTAWYRQHLDAIFKRRREYCAASQGRVELSFTPNPERSFNRGFTAYFMHGRTSDLCNTVTPKSTGERVGFVKEIRRDHIVVAGTASFANGDGLCYVSGPKGQEQLVGFRINRAEGNHLYPHRMPQGLKDGTTIYRNQDQAMESVLAGQTAVRRLPLAWTLEEIPQGFRLTATVGTHAASREYECEHQEARTDQSSSIRDVLSKLGGTIYEVTNTEISFSQPWFIPRSRLAEWRREVLAVMEGEEQRPLPLTQSSRRKGDCSPHGAEIDIQSICQGLHSPQGRGVYTSDCSIGKNNPQNIILPPLAGGMGRGQGLPPLMTCRYCIRYQLGQCLKRNPQAVRGPLYLRGADGRRFLLRFDCKACQMTVEIER